MKKSTLVTATITVMFALTAFSCDSSPHNMERAENSVFDVKRDVDIAQSKIESEIRIYRQEIANEIRENNMAIVEIKEKIEDEEGDVKETYESRIEDLENDNNNLKRQIDNYHVSNRNHWIDFKKDFSNNMDDLGTSLDYFFITTTASLQ